MKNLQLRQLDRQLKKLRESFIKIEMPSQGWIKKIRMALKMTGKQLGKKIQKTQQNVSILEKNEVEGTITLQSLEEMARALNCKFYYAFIPEDRLEERVKNKFLKKRKKKWLISLIQ